MGVSGFPIGGVAAFDVERGVISPGGVGYDIKSRGDAADSNRFDAGGRAAISREAHDRTLSESAGWCRGERISFGSRGGISSSDDPWGQVVCGAGIRVASGSHPHGKKGGCIEGADPSVVTNHAIQRGINQLGTLGSGNHYLEVQVVSNERIFDPVTAAALGIIGHEQIVVMVHCGSRGFGHQVASDYLGV